MGPGPPDLERLLAERDFVTRLARNLLHDEHLAEDAAQEALLAAMRRPPTSALATRAWLSAVTRNFANQVARGRIRRIERERRAARAEAAPPPADSAREEIGRAVLGLDEPYRSTILMRFFEGLMPAAMADRLAVPVDTVKTRLKRALAMLRARISEAREGADEARPP